MKLFKANDPALPVVSDDPAVREAAARVRDLAAREHALARRVEALTNGVPLEDLQRLDELQRERDGIKVTVEQQRRGAPPAKRLQAIDREMRELRERINRTAMQHGRTRRDLAQAQASASIDREAQELLGRPADASSPESVGEMEHDLAVLRRALEIARDEDKAARQAARERLKAAALPMYRERLEELAEVLVEAGRLADELNAFEFQIQEAAGVGGLIHGVPCHFARLSEMSPAKVWLADIARTHGVTVDAPSMAKAG